MHEESVTRAKRRHVFIIDGTLSRIEEGDETNAGILFKLLTENGPQASQTVGYDPGVQAEGFAKWIKVAAGTGINESILQGYATLCSRYRSGDSIMLFGYSRGAYAVRSLAGLIGRIGMLRAEEATQRRIYRAFRYYESVTPSKAAKDFCEAYCHARVEIELLGVWDTVKSLGLPYPILNRLAPMATEFHDHSLLNNTRNAYQALALDENRTSYSKAEKSGLRLPQDWRHEFPQNPKAPMHGPYRGNGRLFIARGPREVGLCSSESIHRSVFDRMAAQKRYKPRAVINSQKTEQETEWRGHIPGGLQPE